ncbi:class D sortase [Lysinibacillus telephonicus]|uniref:Class D sortase n=1 Tax=Lysinibacillus telephonicus TaxID=1714840 RepID=A0A3S0HNF1_9BACI|nr:class D sortase [Lysinibacillus telephonicus]
MERFGLLKLEAFNNRQKNHKKRLVFVLFSIGVIIFGTCFSTVNIYKFVNGNIVVKTGSLSEQVIDKKQSKNNEPGQALYPTRPEIGEEIGELYIPKLDAKLPIYHGTNEDELARGVGHFAESVLPGENDNSVLSGHRDTVFRKLGEIGEGDELIVRTSAGEFKYIVYKVRIVDENDRTVIVPKPRATLTVTTCYPFDDFASATERYILVAYLASEKVG